jgi:hypothetical protein
MSCSNCDINGICQGRCFDDSSTVLDIEFYLRNLLQVTTRTRDYLLVVLREHKLAYSKSPDGLTYANRNSLNKIRDAIDKANAEIAKLEAANLPDPLPSVHGRLVAQAQGSVSL